MTKRLMDYALLINPSCVFYHVDTEHECDSRGVHCSIRRSQAKIDGLRMICPVTVR